MGLLDELAALETARKTAGGVPCRIAVVLADMGEDERATLRRLLDQTDTYGTQIAAALTAHGYQVNGAQIQHHRRRLRGAGCSCPPPDEAT